MHYPFLVPLDSSSFRGTSFCVPLFLAYEENLLAPGCYAYVHQWLVPIHHNDIYSHFGLSSSWFLFTNGFPYYIIFLHMSFLSTTKTFHIIICAKSLISIITLVVIIINMPPNILPPLASIILLVIPFWWLVIWLIVKPSLVIGPKILLLP